MESVKKQVRAIWPLLKVRVVDLTEAGVKLAIGADYGAPTTMQIKADMRGYDIRVGDQLTLYTEVLLKEARGTS